MEDNIAYEFMMNGSSMCDALRMADEYRDVQQELATLRAENAALRSLYDAFKRYDEEDNYEAFKGIRSAYEQAKEALK